MSEALLTELAELMTLSKPALAQRWTQLRRRPAPQVSSRLLRLALA